MKPSNIKLYMVILVFVYKSVGVAFGETGYATYYTVKSCQKEGNSGVYTASGERFNEGLMTCALRKRSFGREYVVYGLKKGTSVVVRHNDYGPGKGPTARGVVIDLSPAAFKEVCGDLSLGKCEVSYQEVSRDYFGPKETT